MNTNRVVGILLCLMGLGASGRARAQTTTPVPNRPATFLSASSLPGPPSEAARYAVAHDSLTRLVNTAYANAETLVISFREAYSTLGSVHRQIKGYSDAGRKQLVQA